MDVMIGTSERDMMAALRVEFDAANVGLALDGADRSLVRRGPDLDLGVIASTGQSCWICP